MGSRQEANTVDDAPLRSCQTYTESCREYTVFYDCIEVGEDVSDSIFDIYRGRYVVVEDRTEKDALVPSECNDERDNSEKLFMQLGSSSIDGQACSSTDHDSLSLLVSDIRTRDSSGSADNVGSYNYANTENLTNSESITEVSLGVSPGYTFLASDKTAEGATSAGPAHDSTLPHITDDKNTPRMEGKSLCAKKKPGEMRNKICDVTLNTGLTPVIEVEAENIHIECQVNGSESSLLATEPIIMPAITDRLFKGYTVTNTGCGCGDNRGPEEMPEVIKKQENDALEKNKYPGDYCVSNEVSTEIECIVSHDGSEDVFQFTVTELATEGQCDSSGESSSSCHALGGDVVRVTTGGGECRKRSRRGTENTVNNNCSSQSYSGKSAISYCEMRVKSLIRP